ncbi:MAG TPA: PAS domain S-box protein [Anaerohalosphaeraceae bacterium]|nr:PAS domain S-box protein [Anaerohalosphaeraceae bacterium]
MSRAQAVGSIGSWRLDIQRNELTWSDENHRIFGIPRGTPLTYETFLSIVHPEDREYVDQKWNAALRGENYDIDHRLVVEGKIKWVREKAYLEFDKSGGLLGGFGITQDITERRMMEEKLRHGSKRFEILSETASQLLQEKNPQQIVDSLCRKVMEHLDCHIFVNYLVDESAHRLHLNASAGMPEEMARRIEWLDFGQAICGRVAQEGRRIVAEDIQESCDSRADLVRSIGIRAYACHPLLLQGRIIGTLSFGTRSRSTFSEDDLAMMKTVADEVATAIERKRTVEALEAAVEATLNEKQQLEAVMESLPVGVSILNARGRVIKTNDAFRHIWGAPVHSARDVSDYVKYKAWWCDTRKPVEPDEWASSMALQKGQAVFGQELEIERFDGTRAFVLNSGVPIRDSMGHITGSVVAILDISDRKRAEELLRKSYEELEQKVKQRTAELSQAVASLKEHILKQTLAEQALGAERQRFSDVLNMLPAYVILLTPDYHVAFANRFFEERFGSHCGRRCYEFLFERSDPCENCETFTILRTNAPHEWEWVGPDGRNYFIRDVPFTDIDGAALIMEMGIDITELKQAQLRTQITSALLALFTKKTSRKDYLDSVVKMISECYDCQCAGIRLTDSEGCIPYAASVGFSDNFLTMENSLSLKNDTCLCLRAISQKPECRDIPMVTSKGSFCCDNIIQFVDTLSSEERGRYRTACLRHGYASLAVIPVHYRDAIIGVIHLADKRKNQFPPAMVDFLESVAMLIGEAVHRFGIETELRNSEERYRLLVELSPEGIGVERDGRLVFINPAGSKLLGCRKPDELFGRPILDFIHPQSREQVRRELNSLYELQQIQSGHEVKFLRVDGTEIEVEIAASPLIYQGKPSAQIVFHDVTERKRQQEALQLSESRLLEAQQVAHLGNWELDLTTHAIWWSDEVYRIFGLTPKQSPATYEMFLSYVHPEDRNAVIEAVKTALAEGVQYSIDHRIIRPDGFERVVHEQAKIMYDANQHPLRLVGIVLDITDRVRAEDAVRQSEERFRLMAQASKDVFWVSTPGIGQMLYISPAYETLWGKTRKSLYRNPKTFLDSVHPDDREKLIAGIQGHAQGQWDYEYRILQADGSVRWVHDVGYPVRNEQGELTLMAGIVRDITDRKKAEEDILAQQKELRSLAIQLQLAEERERRRIAQDLHDSIGQILSFSGNELKILQRSVPDGIAEALRTITEQLDIAVDQARSLSFDLSPSLLYDLGLEVAIEDLADRISRERKLKCSFRSCSREKPLNEDVKILLYRGTRELLINASKHAQATQVTISCVRSGSSIVIEIQDDGRGFDVSRLQDHNGKAQGFGLMNLRERLHYIGGSMKIESNAGAGTKVILTAPLNTEQNSQKEIAREH